MNVILLNKLSQKKKFYLKDGFEIVAIFGSFARGEERIDSDIDLLYKIQPKFLEKYSGFEAFSQLNKIKKELKISLNRDVDIATMDNHSKTFKEFALKDLIYVK